MNALPYLLDVTPLLEYAAMCAGRVAPEEKSTVYGVGVPVLAEHLGTSKRQVHRWLASGTINAYTADRCCVHLGVHPIEIWGDDWHGGAIAC